MGWVSYANKCQLIPPGWHFLVTVYCLFAKQNPISKNKSQNVKNIYVQS